MPVYMRHTWMKNPAHGIPDPDGLVAAALQRAGRRSEKLLLQNYKTMKLWQNRTFKLIKSAEAKASVGGAQLRIQLKTNTKYAVFVETRWGGRYQSQQPTLRATLPQAMAIALEEIMRS